MPNTFEKISDELDNMRNVLKRLREDTETNPLTEEERKELQELADKFKGLRQKFFKDIEESKENYNG